MILKCIGSGSLGNAYALIGEEEILLLECGMPLKEVKKAIDWQILKIKGCVLSHIHADHSKYIKDYLNAGISVFTNEETKENISTMPGNRLCARKEGEPFQAGSFKIIPFYVPHEDTFCFAYLIEHKEMGKLLFATDYCYLPWSFKQQRIEHFLVEANYCDECIDSDIPNYPHVLCGHASFKTCMDMIETNKTDQLRNVIMCHLGRGTEPRGYLVEKMQEVTGMYVNVVCAQSGGCVELKRDPF